MKSVTLFDRKLIIDKYFFLVILKMLPVLLLFGYAYLQFDIYFQRLLVHNAKTEAQVQLGNMVKGVKNLLEQRLTCLTAISAYTEIHASEPDFEKRFKVFAAGLYQGRDGIRNFVVAPGGVNRYVYPLKGNEQALGHNLLLDNRPEVRSDIQRSLSTRTPVIGAPYELRQGGNGIAARQALYDGARFWGLVTMVLDWDYLQRKLKSPPQLNVAIRANTGKVFYGKPDLFREDAVLEMVKFPGSYWEFGALPIGGWNALIGIDLLIARIIAFFFLILLIWGTFVIISNQANLAEEARLIHKILQLLGEDRFSYRKYVIYPVYKVIGLYIILGCIWIVFSDHLLMIAGKGFRIETLTRLQTYKGWIYVIASAFLIYLLIRYYLKMVYLSSKGRLQTSGLLFQCLTSNFPNGMVCLFDKDMKVVSMEGTALTCMEQLKSPPELRCFHECFPQPFRTKLQRLSEATLGGSAELIEITYHQETYQFNLFPVNNFSGEIVAGLAVIQNISSLRQIEANLKVSEERLRYALEGTNDALWDWNLDSMVIFFSPGYASMLGYERQEQDIPWDVWLDTIHPEDRDQARRMLGDAKLSAQSCHLEFRVNANHNRWVWLLLRGKVIRNADKPARIIGTISDISERKRADEQIRKLSNEIIHSQEEERRRISRELHDEAGQALTALSIYLELIKKGLSEADQQLHHQMSEAIALSGHTLEQIRSLAQGLRPAALETVGLNSALVEYCNDFSKKTMLSIDYSGVELQNVPYEIGITLYRFLQETLTNIMKHARANQAVIRLKHQEGLISLDVADNGKGITRGSDTQVIQGIGLIGIKERLHFLNGELQMDSVPGKGLRVTAVIPWGG